MKQIKERRRSKKNEGGRRSRENVQYTTYRYCWEKSENQSEREQHEEEEEGGKKLYAMCTVHLVTICNRFLFRRIILLNWPLSWSEGSVFLTPLYQQLQQNQSWIVSFFFFLFLLSFIIKNECNHALNPLDELFHIHTHTHIHSCEMFTCSVRSSEAIHPLKSTFDLQWNRLHWNRHSAQMWIIVFIWNLSTQLINRYYLTKSEKNIEKIKNYPHIGNDPR